MVGLTGSYDAVKQTCKSYRVYFSTPPNANPGEDQTLMKSPPDWLQSEDDDYLVDHSIFFYLMDPLGNFVEAFGKSSTAEAVCRKFYESKEEWREKEANPNKSS